MKGATWQEAQDELMLKKNFKTADKLGEIIVGKYYYYGKEKTKLKCLSIEAESLTGEFSSWWEPKIRLDLEKIYIKKYDDSKK